MTTKSRGSLRAAAALLLLALLLAVSFVVFTSRPKAEDRYPVSTKDEVIAHETTTVADPGAWENESVVTTEGKDGVRRTYTYFHDRLVNGKVTLHQRIETPVGKPSTLVVSEPTTEIVTVGTRKGVHYSVNATKNFAQPIAVIGPSGTMWIEATGTVTFAAGGGNGGVYGNSVYRYYYVPLRPGVPAGALLLKVGEGDWRGLKELPSKSSAFMLQGDPGERVYAIVNDAPRYFNDNNGSFGVSIWPDGTGPQ